MGKYAGGIVRNVEALIEPILREMGMELVDVEYLVDRGRRTLRAYIDKPGGVTVDDCARVSGEIGLLIDVKDVMPGKYVLEVSSPGLDRPLKKRNEFELAKGKRVKVKLKTPFKGRSNLSGYLVRVELEAIHLDIDSYEQEIPFQRIEKANLIYEF